MTSKIEHKEVDMLIELFKCGEIIQLTSSDKKMSLIEVCLQDLSLSNPKEETIIIYGYRVR